MKTDKTPELSALHLLEDAVVHLTRMQRGYHEQLLEMQRQLDRTVALIGTLRAEMNIAPADVIHLVRSSSRGN